MEENNKFSLGEPAIQTKKSKELTKWDEITAKLNSLGPAMMTADEWKQYYLDWESEVAEKLQKKLVAEQQTGGAPSGITFDENEKKVIKLRLGNLLDGDGDLASFIDDHVDMGSTGSEQKNPAKTVTKRRQDYAPTPKKVRSYRSHNDQVERAMETLQETQNELLGKLIDVTTEILAEVKEIKAMRQNIP